MAMNKTFADSEEKFLKRVIVYGHSDNALYVDEAHTTKLSKDDALNLCVKGLMVVHMDETYYNPVLFKENGGKVDVTIATTIGTGTSESKVLSSDTAA